jgi:hypothetical protein
LKQVTQKVRTTEPAVSLDGMAFQFELIVKPPRTLLTLDQWSNVVGAIIDLDSERGSTPPDVLHAQICSRISNAHRADAPALASKVGYYLRFLLNGEPSHEQERLIDLLEMEARARLKSTGIIVDTSEEIPWLEMYRRALMHVERRMRQLAR